MTNPPSPRSRFGIEFSLLARRWRRSIDRHLLAVGLTDATWVPLVHLSRSGGGITKKELARLVGVDASSLVRVLDILAREGLIERQQDAADGRAKLIHLTQKGEHKLADVLRELATIEAELLSGLSDKEIAEMLGHFSSIDRRISELEVEGTVESSK